MKEEKDIFDFLEKRPIQTPEKEYFAALAQKAMDRANQEPPVVKIIPLYRRPLLWVASSAAAVLLLFLWNSKTDIPKDAPSLALKDLSQKEILAYVDANIEDFDEELLIEFIPQNRINIATSTALQIEPQSLPKTGENANLTRSLESISDEEILEYLQDESIDLDDLEDDIY